MIWPSESGLKGNNTQLVTDVRIMAVWQRHARLMKHATSPARKIDFGRHVVIGIARMAYGVRLSRLGLHDMWQIGVQRAFGRSGEFMRTYVFNVPGMGVTAAVTYSALMRGQPSVALAVDE